MSGKQIKSRKEYMREYRKKHLDEIREYNRLWMRWYRSGKQGERPKVKIARKRFWNKLLKALFNER